MRRLYVDRATMMDFLARLQASFARRGRLYLVGESIQVCEGWNNHTRCLEFAAEIDPGDRGEFSRIFHQLADEMSIPVNEESPAEVIPLPKGYQDRSRPAAGGSDGLLELFYFDPYSIAFRLITRGDEPDYSAVLAFLDNGWITVEGMNSLLSGLLPQFNKETIAQDPAEFRRKYRGLLQMWREKVQKHHGEVGQEMEK